MKKITTILVYALMSIFLFLGFSLAIDRKEKVECAKWATWAQEYSDFYYLGWQKEQCEIK